MKKMIVMFLGIILFSNNFALSAGMYCNPSLKFSVEVIHTNNYALVGPDEVIYCKIPESYNEDIYRCDDGSFFRFQKDNVGLVIIDMDEEVVGEFSVCDSQ